MARPRRSHEPLTGKAASKHASPDVGPNGTHRGPPAAIEGPTATSVRKLTETFVRLDSPGTTNAQVNVVLTRAAGERYKVQSTTDFSSSNWTDEPRHGQAQFSEQVTSNKAKCYRAVKMR